jgi:hypothetical protein
MLVKYEGLEARCRIGKITERLVLAHGPHNFCEFSRTTTRRLKNGCFCAVWSVTQVQDLCLPQQRQPAPQYRRICERASCVRIFPLYVPEVTVDPKKMEAFFETAASGARPERDTGCKARPLHHRSHRHSPCGRIGCAHSRLRGAGAERWTGAGLCATRPQRRASGGELMRAHLSGAHIAAQA